jgi:hypothetical protein
MAGILLLNSEEISDFGQEMLVNPSFARVKIYNLD